MKRVLFAALLLACSQSQGEHLRTESQTILKGVDDTTHTGVVAIWIDPTFQSGVGFCSGFLIADNLVLTARHCVSDDSPPSTSLHCADSIDADGGIVPANKTGTPAAASAFNVTNRQVAFSDTTFAKVKQVFVPPGTESGAVHCGNDVALLWLADRIDGATPIEPRLTKPVIGETLSVVGYGYNGADTMSDGVRRSADGSKVLSIGETSSGGVVRTSANDWTIDKGPCGGDSGSPALDADGKAIGVMSRGKPTVCTSMIYNRIDPFADWLVDRARATAQDDGIATPVWAAPPPAPEAGADADANPAPPPTTPAKGGCNASNGDAPNGFLTLLLAVLFVAARQGFDRKSS